MHKNVDNYKSSYQILENLVWTNNRKVIFCVQGLRKF